MNNIMNIGGIDCYEKDGIVYLKLETVARGLGFTQKAASGNESVRWERVRKYLYELGVPTCGYDGFIPENIFYRLAMKAKNETAERFQAKVADEIIPSIRRTGGYGRQDAALLKLTEHVGKLTEIVMGLYEDKIREERALPQRAEQIALDGTKGRELCGVTELLNRFDLAYGAAEFNAMLREKGYMERRRYERLWKDGEREIDILTEKGLPYGQNSKHPRSPRGAQPKYYADSFLVFYKKVIEE